MIGTLNVRSHPGSMHWLSKAWTWWFKRSDPEYHLGVRTMPRQTESDAPRPYRIDLAVPSPSERVESSNHRQEPLATSCSREDGPHRVLVASEDPVLTARIQEVFRHEGHDCLISSVAPASVILNRLAEARPAMVLVVLEPDPEKALALLTELRGVFPGCLLAVGPPSDPKLILRALRLGADYYLDQAELPSELGAVLIRLRSPAAVPTTPATTGKLVAVLAASGGSGASTLAVNLAALLAREHRTCALLGLQPGVGDLAALLDLKPTYTLADLCQNASQLDEMMLERSLVGHASGVHLLAGPRTITDLKAVTSAAVGRILHMARARFPHILADLDDCCHEEQVQALLQADLTLLVFRLDFTSLRNARWVLEQLEQIGVDRQRIQLVVNRHGQSRELPAAIAQEALGAPIDQYIPDDPRTMNRANNTGIPAVLEVPSAKVCKSIAQLARKITSRC